MVDVLKKITEQRIARNWTEYQLAVRSGLPQSTISSWYRKNLTPSISSIEKICDAFDMTLAQFFSEGTVMEITPQQAELLSAWELLSPSQKKHLLAFLNSLMTKDSP